MMGLTEWSSIYTTVSARMFGWSPTRSLTSRGLKGKIQRTKGVHTDDFMYLKALVPPEVCDLAFRHGRPLSKLQEVKYIKITICGPTWMHLRHGSEHTYDKSVYATDGELQVRIACAQPVSKGSQPNTSRISSRHIVKRSTSSISLGVVISNSTIRPSPSSAQNQ